MLLFSRYGSPPSFSSDRDSRESSGFFFNFFFLYFLIFFLVEILSRIGGPD